MRFRFKNVWALLLLLSLPVSVTAQSLAPDQTLARLQAGINLFGQGKWRETVLELRRVQAEAPAKEVRAEALFWISLSELSAGEYEEALRDMDALEITDPASYRLRELSYHRGRALYYLGRYDDAIVYFKSFADSLAPADGNVLSSAALSQKAAAYYWTGECLFSMGQLDRAGEFFRLITEMYPGSPKYEASVYRLAMINQKKVETELLNLLKWSHEESLKNVEEFRRKESAYDQALSAYQKRISDMLKDTRLQDLEDSNAGFKEQLVLAEERIRMLENALRETTATLEKTRDSSSMDRLKALRSSAQELENQIRENGR